MVVECTHLDEIKVTQPTKHVCEDCKKMGTPGCTCGCVSLVAMSVAAIRRRTVTRESIITRRMVHLSDLLNLVSGGSGVMSMTLKQEYCRLP
jgi:hypothetical protein